MLPNRWLFKLVGEHVDVRANVYRWTGRNNYFALCESTFISFGGGSVIFVGGNIDSNFAWLTYPPVARSDGKYGLYLDAAFMRGSSARCPAYDNEVLCDDEHSTAEKMRFECMGMEVWAT